MTIAAEFAKSRYTLGVPIATLQAISHPLANMVITVEGGRNLARRAAWFLDNEPHARPELAPSHSCSWPKKRPSRDDGRTHPRWLGVSSEAAATAYLVRARGGWPLAGGDPGASAKQIGRLLADRETA